MRTGNVKFNESDLVATGKTPEGQVVFLESGNSKAGLQHIIESHGADFAKVGVAEQAISSVVMHALTTGSLVGYQGRGKGRPIYQALVAGQIQRIAVTTGSNGFIVGANPAGGVK